MDWMNRRLAGRLIVLAVLLLSLFMIAAKPAEAQAFGVNHIVQRGQTLSQIASIYGTTVQAILTANPQISNPNIIYAGQTIFVPFGTQPPPPPTPPPPPQPPPPRPPAATCRAYHYVLPGQTMLMISRMYNVDPFAIARANNIFNLNLIYSGSTLCIP
jgi:LysM repeat protein